jgi:anti-sigma regulatory factor (Ser/Thr protein kinase)
VTPEGTATIRAELRAALPPTVPSEVADHLELAVLEVVANAHRHGRPPVRTEVEVVDGAVQVRVTDRGTGPSERRVPTDPPGPTAEGGRGRWLAHHLADVEERRTHDGFEVTLRPRTAGTRTVAD